MKHKKGIWLYILPILIISFLFSNLVYAYDENIVEKCPNAPFCTEGNNTYGQFLFDGESYTFDAIINTSGKGEYSFSAIANSEANSTYTYSDNISVTIFEKGFIIPVCTEKTIGDVFCVNMSSYNSTILSGGESYILTANIEVDQNAPINSNWTFYAMANSSINETWVNSDSVIVTVVPPY